MKGNGICSAAFCESAALRGTNPLRRSRARFPLLSPTVTSSPGAGEVFPQRGSQAVKFITKVLGAMRKLPAVLLALPLGELSPQVTERASPLPCRRQTKKQPNRAVWLLFCL